MAERKHNKLTKIYLKTLHVVVEGAFMKEIGIMRLAILWFGVCMVE
jgi:hypothetical protein